MIRRPTFVFFESLERRSLFTSTSNVTDPFTPTFACPCGCGNGNTSSKYVTELKNLQAQNTAAAVSPAARDFNVRINFAPEDTNTVRGYKLDYGAKFSQRGNGLRYGWSSDRRTQARFDDDARYDNLKAETNIAMNGASWSIAVPNGWYQVSAIMGTVANLNAHYALNANGQMVVNGEPYKPAFPWVEGVKVIRVTTGRITINTASLAEGTQRLAAVGIMSVNEPTQAPEDVGIKWTRSSLQSPVHRAEAGAVRVGDRLFIFGGYSNGYDTAHTRFDILNVKTGQWTRGANLPGAQTHFGVATDGTSIYVAGGQYGPQLSNRGTTEVWKYDIAGNTWSRFVSLPSIRFGGSLTYLNGRLHFVGGNDKTRVRSTADHFILDLGRLRKGWYAGADLPQATDHHSAIAVNGNLYILGGEVEHGTSYIQNNGFFQYDANANKWITLPPLPVASSHNETSTLTDGKRIFLIAGQVDQQQLTDEVRSFDFKRNRWVTHTPLPTARKAGLSWLEGNTIFYMTGDDVRHGEPRWTYQGKIGG